MATFRPVIIIPSFNTGAILLTTVRRALEAAHPYHVLVSLDGCRDDSAQSLAPLVDRYEGRLNIIIDSHNRGKGAAIHRGTLRARLEGYTHVLTMDADGQHPAALIPEFFRLGARYPDDLIAGQPVFGPDAPILRVLGRRVANYFAAIQTPGAELGDSLFGMRLYPIKRLISAFEQTLYARGYDFDTEIAVRVIWLGCRVHPLNVPVRYFRRSEGGVSHYNYFRDNIILAFCHFRLLCEYIRQRRGRDSE